MNITEFAPFLTLSGRKVKGPQRDIHSICEFQEITGDSGVTLVRLLRNTLTPVRIGNWCELQKKLVLFGGAIKKTIALIISGFVLFTMLELVYAQDKPSAFMIVILKAN